MNDNKNIGKGSESNVSDTELICTQYRFRHLNPLLNVSIGRRLSLLSGIIICFICISLPVSLMALTSDRDQPISLEADFADVDDLNGISIYTGNVILIQGSMLIKAEKLTLHHNNAERDLEKAIAEGKKKTASFKQRPEGKQQDFRARL